MDYKCVWAQKKWKWEVYLDAYEQWEEERVRRVRIYTEMTKDMEREEAKRLYEGKFPWPPVYPKSQLMISEAAAKGDTVKLAGALEHEDGDPSGKDCGLWTPLMYAAGEGSLECVEYLVDFGADITAEDNSGDTALDVAIGQHGRKQYDHPVILYLHQIGCPRGCGWRARLPRDRCWEDKDVTSLY